MGYTFEQLKKKTVAQLREIAKGLDHEAVQGYSQLHKEQLLMAVSTALGIDPHEHKTAKGINKGEIKSQIRELKMERDKALEAKDHGKLKEVRRQIHQLKHKLRRAAV